MTDPSPPATEPRRAFTDEIFERSQEFAQALITDVPELAGVSIGFAYSLDGLNVPRGLVIGRHGPLQQPAEIEKMASTLLVMLRTQLDNLRKILTTVDTYAQEQAQLLAARKQELAELDARLSARQPAAAGPPAGGSGSDADRHPG